MDEVFMKASLCYLTNRCDEGFELINLSIKSSNNDIYLNWEEEEVFCLISMNIIEKRFQSWIRLNRILVKTDHFKKRQSIKIYIKIILNEINLYSKNIFLLINKYLLKPSISVYLRICYLKIQGDIHFLLSQTSISEKKLEHMHSSLNFYNQSLEICYHHAFYQLLLSITYNKALVLQFLFLFFSFI
ncbi:unnamed protein product [Rotaria sp. Silwood1]|nr:unnamed protein product [Rotaria sp. Silwood1]